MAGFTVVGVETATDDYPGGSSIDVPVPAGTSTSDLLVLSWGNGTISDARFGGSRPLREGLATSLGDATVYQVGTYPLLAAMMSLTMSDITPAGVVFGYQNPDAGGDDYAEELWPGDASSVAAVARVWHNTLTPSGTITIGAASGWDAISSITASATGGYVEQHRLFAYTGPGPVPALSTTYGADTYTRSWDVLLFNAIPPTTRPYLRQRQSPRANPRVSLNHPTLRQRQYIP